MTQNSKRVGGSERYVKNNVGFTFLLTIFNELLEI